MVSKKSAKTFKLKIVDIMILQTNDVKFVMTDFICKMDFVKDFTLNCLYAAKKILMLKKLLNFTKNSNLKFFMAKICKMNMAVISVVIMSMF